MHLFSNLNIFEHILNAFHHTMFMIPFELPFEALKHKIKMTWKWVLTIIFCSNTFVWQTMSEFNKRQAELVMYILELLWTHFKCECWNYRFTSGTTASFSRSLFKNNQEYIIRTTRLDNAQKSKNIIRTKLSLSSANSTLRKLSLPNLSLYYFRLVLQMQKLLPTGQIWKMMKAALSRFFDFRVF